MNRITNVFAALIICAVGFAASAFAQGTTGQISGVISDPNGAVIQGAAVTAKSLDTNFSRSITTDSGGVFAFQLLPPGRYRITVTASGFQETSADVVVNITQTTNVNIPLSVSGVNVEPVVVTSEAPVLQNETSQMGRVVEGETLRQLPLPTRNFQQLLTLQAGAQSSVSNNTELGRGDSTISVNGQRNTSNSGLTRIQSERIQRRTLPFRRAIRSRNLSSRLRFTMHLTVEMSGVTLKQLRAAVQTTFTETSITF